MTNASSVLRLVFEKLPTNVPECLSCPINLLLTNLCHTDTKKRKKKDFCGVMSILNCTKGLKNVALEARKIACQHRRSFDCTGHQFEGSDVTQAGFPIPFQCTGEE